MPSTFSQIDLFIIYSPFKGTFFIWSRCHQIINLLIAMISPDYISIFTLNQAYYVEIFNNQPQITVIGVCSAASAECCIELFFAYAELLEYSALPFCHRVVQ